MKKINMVVACLLGMACMFGGCASTPQSEAYLQTPIGDGSESGFVMTATLPDGTTREMHLFADYNEQREFLEDKIGFDKTWHSKSPYTSSQILKMNSKTADLHLDFLRMIPYSFDEIGEIGKIMKEKGLRFAINVEKMSDGDYKDYVEFAITAMDKKYTIFRYTVYLVTNEPEMSHEEMGALLYLTY